MTDSEAAELERRLSFVVSVLGGSAAAVDNIGDPIDRR